MAIKEAAARLLTTLGAVEISGNGLIVRNLITQKEALRVALAEETKDFDLIELRNILMLCGEPECRDIEDYPDKLRALIAGLVKAKKKIKTLSNERSEVLRT